MRQVLANSNGAFVARVPRPVAEPGSVLVRVHYSLISAGTEIAALRPLGDATGDIGATERARLISGTAKRYATKAWRNPRLAARRASEMARRWMAAARHDAETTVSVDYPFDKMVWRRAAAVDMSADGKRLRVTTDDSPARYQVMTEPLEVPAGFTPVVAIRGTVSGAPISVGLLNDGESSWIGANTLSVGAQDERLFFEAADSRHVTLVIANAGAGAAAELDFRDVSVTMRPPRSDGLPHSEMGDQGWGLGYSLSGEVVAVGDGVGDLSIGDRVACAGVGQANHADFVCVKRNLVCPVPDGCSMLAAAATTVGSIALQGVRRADPSLGERICVIGLGLIGQLTAQMLRANGCVVIGMDLEESRLARARALGIDAAVRDAGELAAVVRDLSDGNGVDKTIITAATKSDTVVNLAMELTRRKGAVVLVGDVGLSIERPNFYRKEIDLLMSTSYGPGRYDRAYEDEGHDYPYSYVRWTMNRNMKTFMELSAMGRIDVEALADRVVPIDEARQIYRQLVQEEDDRPLGVFFDYGATDGGGARDADEPKPTQISLRGHRRYEGSGVLNYALVGAGAFGTSMLVPQMEKRGDRFALRGVVSRDAARGGNFARAQRVEVLASDISAILREPDFDLVVIATRHDRHADQVIASLRAGKHVFVEKPLAISWRQLDMVEHAWASLAEPPYLLVGFNRRFAPAIRRLRDMTSRRRTPLIINYRINAGYIPPDHWVHGPEGGGRNIGEACHMYDVFRSLADAPVVEVSATPITPTDGAHLRNDNFCATLKYADGSVGNLVYTALGPKQGLAKERIEVFCDGEAYIVDDYKALLKAGDATPLWRADAADKGHFEELSRLGDAIATGGDTPIPADEIFETTAVALEIEDQLLGRARSADVAEPIA